MGGTWVEVVEVGKPKLRAMVALVGPLGWSLTCEPLTRRKENSVCICQPAREDVGHCIADAFRCGGGLDSDTDRYQ